MMQWIRYKKEVGLYKKKNIIKEQYTNINEIKAYTIDTLCIMKSNAYISKGKIRDLYDLCCIGNKYYDKLSLATKFVLQNTLEYTGWERFNYIIQAQKDPLIDNNKLVDNFLKLYDKAGLLYDKNEKQQIKSLTKSSQHKSNDRDIGR